MQQLGTKLGGFLCILVQGFGHIRLVLAAASYSGNLLLPES